MVFITGSNGLVGGFVTKLYTEMGYRVKALRRPGATLNVDLDYPQLVDWIEGDVRDVQVLTQAIEPGDVVIHAAALVSFHPSEREKMFGVNVEGTANVVNVCLERKARKLCFVSSIAALGRGKTTLPIDENTKWEESEWNSAYAHSKKQAELEVWRGVAEGLPAVIVNPSVILGPGNWNRSSTQLFKYAWDEHVFYPGGQVNYVDVRDVAEIIFKLVHSEINAERFILNAGNVQYYALFSRMAQLFGKRAPLIRGKSWMVEFAWRMEWLKWVITRRPPLVTRETARLSRTSYEYRSDKIKNTLNFSFKSLEDTLQWACGELQQQYGKQWSA